MVTNTILGLSVLGYLLPVCFLVFANRRDNHLRMWWWGVGAAAIAALECTLALVHVAFVDRVPLGELPVELRAENSFGFWGGVVRNNLYVVGDLLGVWFFCVALILVTRVRRTRAVGSVVVLFVLNVLEAIRYTSYAALWPMAIPLLFVRDGALRSFMLLLFPLSPPEPIPWTLLIGSFVLLLAIAARKARNNR